MKCESNTSPEIRHKTCCRHHTLVGESCLGRACRLRPTGVGLDGGGELLLSLGLLHLEQLLALLVQVLLSPLQLVLRHLLHLSLATHGSRA